MRTIRALMLIAISVPIGNNLAIADEPRENRIDDAIRRGLSVVQKAAKNYPDHRQCFSCHHQTLPLLAMREAEAAELAIDDEIANGILDHTFKSFHARVKKLRAGRRIGGRANTVSYGLWTLDLAERKADETTAAMVEFLLKNQRDDGRWTPPSNRPPLEASEVAVTVLSAYSMQQFAGASQRDDVEKAAAKARAWLAEAPLESQEDFNFRLWSLALLDHSGEAKSPRQIPEQISALGDKILAAQRDDGGWAQLPPAANDGMKSDAYATGQTLYVLAEVGVASDRAAISAAVDFLLRTQCADGSWQVETRAEPVQIFFDNGDPHGKSQFISIAGTSWAVAALAKVKQRSIR